MGQLQKLIVPKEFLRWAKTVGLPIPPELDEIERVVGTPIEAPAHTVQEEKTLHPKERTSLLRLLHGLLLVSYKCKPSTRGLATEIHRDIDQAGGDPPDPDTIRKVLRMVDEEIDIPTEDKDAA
jgi:hypothetical protein